MISLATHPSDTTPITEATAASTPDIKKTEPSEGEDGTMMFVGIALVVIIILIVILIIFFMIMVPRVFVLIYRMSVIQVLIFMIIY